MSCHEFEPIPNIPFYGHLKPSAFRWPNHKRSEQLDVFLWFTGEQFFNQFLAFARFLQIFGPCVRRCGAEKIASPADRLKAMDSYFFALGLGSANVSSSASEICLTNCTSSFF